MPITPFMGVRISWLMLARKSLFARLAVSASVLAFSSSATAVVSCSVRSSIRLSKPALRRRIAAVARSFSRTRPIIRIMRSPIRMVAPTATTPLESIVYRASTTSKPALSTARRDLVSPIPLLSVVCESSRMEGCSAAAPKNA